MRFSAVITTPPIQEPGYELNTRKPPLYPEFFRLARKMMTPYIVLLIPARWFTGSSLKEFRQELLQGRHIKQLTYYPRSQDAMPELQILGGECILYWNKNVFPRCQYRSIIKARRHQEYQLRDLKEFPVIIPDEHAVPIARKVRMQRTTMMSDLVEGRIPFGVPVGFWGVQEPTKTSHFCFTDRGYINIPLYDITKNRDKIDMYKVVISTHGQDAGMPLLLRHMPIQVFQKLAIVGPGDIVNDSYVVIGIFSTEGEAMRMASYMATKFVRFLVANCTLVFRLDRHSFGLVPQMPMSRTWTDQDLAEYFDLTSEEMAYIDKKIAPIDIIPADEFRAEHAKKLEWRKIQVPWKELVGNLDEFEAEEEEAYIIPGSQ